MVKEGATLHICVVVDRIRAKGPSDQQALLDTRYHLLFQLQVTVLMAANGERRRKLWVHVGGGGVGRCDSILLFLQPLVSPSEDNRRALTTWKVSGYVLETATRKHEKQSGGGCI
jgi:hypothetical protein